MFEQHSAYSTTEIDNNANWKISPCQTNKKQKKNSKLLHTLQHPYFPEHHSLKTQPNGYFVHGDILTFRQPQTTTIFVHQKNSVT